MRQAAVVVASEAESDVPGIAWPTSCNLKFNTDRLTIDDSCNLGIKNNLAVAKNKFTVAGASGNTLVAVTLGVK